jgi:translation elongation factor EF-4
MHGLQVFAGLYPADGETLDRLTDAFEKLTLNDASVTYTKERRYSYCNAAQDVATHVTHHLLQ